MTIQKSRWRFFLALALLLGVGSLFYGIQNNAMLVGGNIALPKIFWLGAVILCWYILPLILLLDTRFAALKILIGIFLGNMLVRGLIELIMMYGLHNWHPYYGISHDLATAFLSLLLAYYALPKLASMAAYFVLMAALFVIEAGFALYMLTTVSAQQGPVYFVPAGSQHSAILQITTLVLIALALFLAFFMKQWFYETSA